MEGHNKEGRAQGSWQSGLWLPVLALPLVQGLSVKFLPDWALVAVSDSLHGLSALLASVILWRTWRGISQPRERAAWMYFCAALMSMVLVDLTELILQALDIKRFPSVADLFLVLFYVLMILGFLRLPRRPLVDRSLVNEMIDAACLLGVISSLLWGAIDTQFFAFFIHGRPAAVAMATSYLCLDVVLLSLVFWSFVRRFETKESAVPMLFLFAACVCLVAGDFLKVRQMVDTGRNLRVVVETLWCSSLAFFAIAALCGQVWNRNIVPRATRFLLSFPREALILWTSQAWLVVALLLTLRDLLYPEEQRFAYFHVTMGAVVALLVAWRQGRNILDLNRVKSALAQSNSSLASSNRELQSLNEEIRRQADNRVREANSKLEDLFARAPVGIYILSVDEVGRPSFESMNPVMEDILGMKQTEIQWPRLGEIVGAEAVGETRAKLRSCIETRRPMEFESTLGAGESVRNLATIMYPIFAPNGCVVRVAAFVRDMTSERQALIALRESEEKFERVFRASPDGIMVTELETGRILLANRQFASLAGASEESLVGRTTEDIGFWQNPQDRERMVAKLRQTGSLQDYEVTIRTPDGQLREVHFSAEVMDLGGSVCVVSILRDVTERRRAERERRESEELFEKAFTAGPDSVLVCEEETGIIMDANQTVLRFLGVRSREEIIGKTVVESKLWPDLRLRNQFMEKFGRAGSVRDFEVSGQNAQGASFWWILNAERIELSGRRCIVALIRDVTEARRAMLERDEAFQREQKLLKEYTGRLILSQEAERRRIAGGLHDSIGQDLLLIKNRLNLLCEGSTLELKTKVELDEISELAVRAISEVRRISHDLRPYQLDHLGLTRALRSMIEATAKGAECRFSHKLEDIDDLFDQDAATGLYRIVQECLNNIVKHSGARTAVLRLERDIHEVQLVIQDDGVGFSSKGVKRGMGLGNIAERVHMLAGVLDVRSEPGAGCRIQVSIPIREGFSDGA